MTEIVLLPLLNGNQTPQNFEIETSLAKRQQLTIMEKEKCNTSDERVQKYQIFNLKPQNIQDQPIKRNVSLI